MLLLILDGSELETMLYNFFYNFSQDLRFSRKVISGSVITDFWVRTSKNAFLSFCEMGSSCSFGTSDGTLESPSCAQQRHGRIPDDSSIKGIIQSQNGYFNDFWVWDTIFCNLFLSGERAIWPKLEKRSRRWPSRASSCCCCCSHRGFAQPCHPTSLSGKL